MLLHQIFVPDFGCTTCAAGFGSKFCLSNRNNDLFTNRLVTITSHGCNQISNDVLDVIRSAILHIQLTTIYRALHSLWCICSIDEPVNAFFADFTDVLSCQYLHLDHLVQKPQQLREVCLYSSACLASPLICCPQQKHW